MATTVMATTTIRVSLRVREVLRALAQTSGRSMQAVVEPAVEPERRQRLLAATNAAYAALRAAPEAWAALAQARLACEQTRAPGGEVT